MTDLIRILVGPLAWLASFSAVYGLQGAACAFGWADTEVGAMSLARMILVAAWIAVIGTQSIILAGLYSRRFASPSGFVRGVSTGTGWVGLFATVWSLFPVVMTSACA